METRVKDNMIITIDGPAGAGKTTIAKTVAKRMNFLYLDTGAMYRAVTLKVLREGIKPEEERKISEVAKQINLKVESDDEKGLRIWIDREEVTDEVRSEYVTNNVWWVCRIPGVREKMKVLQRKIGSKGRIVVEGRDIGTVIFSDAPYKFYLDASVEERARRRWLEERNKGINSDRKKIEEEIRRRDRRDMSREVAPLKKAPDAVYIDTTELSIEEVVEKILSYIR